MNSPEIAWFGALCDDDYEQLGVATPGLESSFAHCHDIVRTAEEEGFDSVLLPSGYHVGLDTTAMAAALAVTTSRIKLLMAVRVGENWPPQLARQIATLQHLAPGRLDINIISSEMAGEHVPSAERYRRTVEVMMILDDLGNARSTDFAGEFFQI
ncbi:MAG: LLM class flavin-dependent oxidoreductase, partial [Actinomycetota bacterium]